MLSLNGTFSDHRSGTRIYVHTLEGSVRVLCIYSHHQPFKTIGMKSRVLDSLTLPISALAHSWFAHPLRRPDPQSTIYLASCSSAWLLFSVPMAPV
ncbi:hypothetical protein M405DRAFT_835471 [Rhizopogon salebrosus TDB-379]|nr:hypothetical protein M405DRAFT_835559 [Rhizopogon salebrosus TDB-379]KAJ8579711.1 hypothetical protein M405DRAFT_835471 [Rhizopogon salebrosus TDB-379]